jgi:hypothetical protein
MGRSCKQPSNCCRIWGRCPIGRRGFYASNASLNKDSNNPSRLRQDFGTLNLSAQCTARKLGLQAEGWFPLQVGATHPGLTRVMAGKVVCPDETLDNLDGSPLRLNIKSFTQQTLKQPLDLPPRLGYYPRRGACARAPPRTRDFAALRPAPPRP